MNTNHFRRFFLIVLLTQFWNCSENSVDSGMEPPEYNTPEYNQTGLPPSSTDARNAYSWDGSWTPSFPVAGLLDEVYDTLPPGKWGWGNDCDCAVDSGLHIYHNEYLGKGLAFKALLDDEENQYGWELVDTDGEGISLNHRGDKFEGSSGVDVLDLNQNGNYGKLQGTGPSDNSTGINLGDGPDMLRYSVGWSVDMRTGSDTKGALYDNDLVILGSEDTLGLNEYDIEGATIHTGPGSDLVFVRNFGPAAIDLGNGLAGRTDVLDSADGDDMIIMAGNMRDFRVFGGFGNDVAVWYVDEVQDDRWLGPNFYGAGAWGDAIWTDPGEDRLILGVDPSTEVVTTRSEHDGNWGSILVMIYSDYSASVDGPTEEDVYARYYGLVPEGPNGEHTLTLSYRSADSTVFTHDFYLTAFEYLQLGVGENAKVYSLNSVSGEVKLNTDAEVISDIPDRSEFNKLFDDVW